MNLSQETLALVKGLRKDVTTSGISNATGLQFYYLEEKAKVIYPVYYPLLASTARVNPTFNGQKVGGPGVNWKAITAIDTGGYPGVSEGNRNAFMNITTRNYYAPYRYLGMDTEVSFQAEQQGMGFDDMIGLAQLNLMNGLLNKEEMMLAFGNSGPQNITGGNGYALGTTPTPTAALVAGGSIPTTTNVSAFCVALTPWGVQLASTTGVYLPTNRTNADGSQDQINGGTGVLSAASNVVATDSGHRTVTFTLATTITGAVAYAWFINSTDASAPTTANSVFSQVTPFNTLTITSLPSSSNQKANATANAGLTLSSGDYSYNTLDFDGIMTWHFGTAGSAQPAYLKDLAGAGFTSNGDGSIAEFEAVADFLWLQYKVAPDKIYTGGNLIQAVTRAMNTSSTGPGATRIVIEHDESGHMTAGALVADYKWKYSTTGAAKVIPVVTHPWLPAGVVLFDITTNPYPAAAAAIPNVRRIVSLEDHFGIKWPYRKLQHETGVYCFETLQHYLPFAGAILTGCAAKVN